MTQPEYPFRIPGEPVELASVDDCEQIGFQEIDDLQRPGVMSIFKRLFRHNELVTAEWVIADNLGPVMNVGEVVVEQTEIDDATTVTIRELIKDHKGMVAAGAVIATSVVLAGTIKAVHRRRD